MSTNPRLVCAAALLAAAVLPGTAHAATDFTDDPQSVAGAPTVTLARPRPHANPRLKISYRSLTMANLDHSGVHFDAAQLDVYALSRRWIRMGVEAEGGAAKAALAGYAAAIYYGAVGLTLGIQFPWRVTPFVEGRVAGGLLGGSMMNASIITYMYMGGIDAGIELYTVSRLYVSASVGWAHPVYHAIDYAYTRANAGAPIKYADISDDTFTFKVGFGI